MTMIARAISVHNRIPVMDGKHSSAAHFVITMEPNIVKTAIRGIFEEDAE